MKLKRTVFLAILLFKAWQALPAQDLSNAHLKALHQLQSISVLKCSYETSYVSHFEKGAWKTDVTKNDSTGVFLVTDINLANRTARISFVLGITSRVSVALHADGLVFADSSEMTDNFGAPLGHQSSMVVYAAGGTEPYKIGFPTASFEELWNAGSPFVIIRVGVCKALVGGS
ncbi:MAG TPA: hypothetical protein VHE82_00110 [Gemmatimonadaceae bacterium]|nr:hypothetical protein [Gemmatimonadaceae bacterium]